LIQDHTSVESDDSTGLELSPAIRQEARSCFARAHRLKPKSPDVLLALGVLAEEKYRRLDPVENVQDRQKIAEEIENAYRRAIRRRSNYVLALNRLGAFLLENGRWAEALPFLEKANKIRPNFRKGLANLADAYIKSGRYAEGLKYYEQALALPRF